MKRQAKTKKAIEVSDVATAKRLYHVHDRVERLGRRQQVDMIGHERPSMNREIWGQSLRAPQKIDK